MKKIITREEKERKNKRNQLIIGFVLILLMILSTLGYALSGSLESDIKKTVYKDITFLKESDTWVFEYGDKQYLVRYNPIEVEDINVPTYITLGSYSNQVLYFAGDRGESFAEIAGNLNDKVTRIQYACVDESCTEDLPVKDCSTDYIIIINEPNVTLSEQENIYQDGNCVYITASYQNQTKYADAFLYKVLGI